MNNNHTKKINRASTNVTVTHGEKIIFPKSKITKQEVIDYYQRVSPYFLPHVEKHLIVMHRFPEGIMHEGFYQKQIPDYFPSFIKRKTIDLKKGAKQTLLYIESEKALCYLVNQGVLVFHSWLSTIRSVNKPDKIVFDLDPSTKTVQKKQLTMLHHAAFALKEILESHNLTPFVMTTGSRGYHIVAPLKPHATFEQTHTFAKNICATLVDTYPKEFTIEMSKSKRKGKIFLDYLRNAYGQTSVAPYALRAQEKAPVATPITWQELPHTVPSQYTMQTIFKKLSAKGDAWHDFRKHARIIK